MKRRWFKKFHLAIRIKSQTKHIRDNINSMAREKVHDKYYEENKRKLLEKVIRLIDTFQELLSPNGRTPELPDYENLTPEATTLSLAELLVIFRWTLLKTAMDVAIASSISNARRSFFTMRTKTTNMSVLIRCCASAAVCASMSVRKVRSWKRSESGFSMVDARYWMLDAGCSMPGDGYYILDARFLIILFDIAFKYSEFWMKIKV